MVMEWLLTGMLVALALLTAISLLNMLFGPFLSKPRRVSLDSSWVTVCIPARNEEENIGGLLRALGAQEYEEYDILVLDDGSDDATSSVVMQHAKDNDKVTLLRGDAVPDGWTGKNWACHQLSRHARGDVLLFVDADVLPDATALRRSVEALEHYRADALSAFPEQVFQGVASSLVVPLMDLVLYSALPLHLVHATRYPSLAAANGQWLMFRRKAYDAIGGHAAVHGDIVEDIRLAQRVKANGLRMLLTSGAGIVRCTMYRNAAEVHEGFSKNFFAAFRFRVFVFSVVLTSMLVLFVLPYALLLFDTSVMTLSAVGLNVLLRSALALRLRHGVVSVLLHPVGVLAAVGIGLHAMWQRFNVGAVTWKGRRIPIRGVGG